MSLTRTTCPNCGAGLKSAAGFNPGQQVRCPKCSSAFAVPEPEDEDEAEPSPKRKRPPARAARADDDDDRPRQRRPRDDDDDDDDDDRPRKKGKKKGGYKNSPVRYAILGVLLVVMGVLAFLLYQKKMREKEDANAPPVATDGEPVDGGARPRPVPQPGPGPIDIGPKADDFRPTGDGPTTAVMTRGNNDLKAIMIAMHLHSDATGALPKAAITAPDGRPLLSWRVAILPYVEQDALFKQFKLNEPWDSPANKPLLAQMPKLYQGTLPTNDGKTAFKVFVGGGSAFDLKQGRQLRAVPDGTSNTFGVVESGRPVDWTKPEEIPFDGKTPPRLVAPTGGDIILVGMLDGSTRRLSVPQNDPDEIRKAVTAAGGEVVNLELR